MEYPKTLNYVKRNRFLTFGSPFISEGEIDEVVDTLRSGWLSTGPKAERFQELFSSYVGSKFACALSSCSAALHLSLIVSGVKPGDEVITTPLTFAATANAIIHVGARPVFVDVEADTMNIDPSLITKKITPKTKAVIPVHFAGRPCRMDEIMDIARRNKLAVIEDASHAIGAEYKGKKIGNIGDLTCFSFYATKNITTAEGGMVTTQSKDWAEKIRILSFSGIDRGPWKRYSQEDIRPSRVLLPGYKYNMTDIQAALGIHQLRKIESFLKLREEVWSRYDDAFKDLPVKVPAAPESNTRHARHLYTLLLDVQGPGIDRDTFRKALYGENIGTGIHFMPLHLEPYYKNTFGYKSGNFPNTEYVAQRTISLPLSAGLNDDDVQDVIKAVFRILNN